MKRVDKTYVRKIRIRNKAIRRSYNVTEQMIAFRENVDKKQSDIPTYNIPESKIVYCENVDKKHAFEISRH